MMTQKNFIAAFAALNLIAAPQVSAIPDIETPLPKAGDASLTLLPSYFEGGENYNDGPFSSASPRVSADGSTLSATSYSWFEDESAALRCSWFF